MHTLNAMIILLKFGAVSMDQNYVEKVRRMTDSDAYNNSLCKVMQIAIARLDQKIVSSLLVDTERSIKRPTSDIQKTIFSMDQ